MRFRLKENDQIFEWHSWFAWKPIFSFDYEQQIETVIWLEYCQRRFLPDGEDGEWEYRAMPTDKPQPQ